jgi:serine/threonine protein kinase
MKGTVAYMAPEMIDNNNKGYDSKIDIWSVGCIVFEMWTGKTPWSGRQDVQILIKASLSFRPSMTFAYICSALRRRDRSYFWAPTSRRYFVVSDGRKF